VVVVVVVFVVVVAVVVVVVTHLRDKIFFAYLIRSKNRDPINTDSKRRNYHYTGRVFIWPFKLCAFCCGSVELV